MRCDAVPREPPASRSSPRLPVNDPLRFPSLHFSFRIFYFAFAHSPKRITAAGFRVLDGVNEEQIPRIPTSPSLTCRKATKSYCNRDGGVGSHATKITRGPIEIGPRVLDVCQSGFAIGRRGCICRRRRDSRSSRRRRTLQNRVSRSRRTSCP